MTTEWNIGQNGGLDS